jgi:hypothetical protein
MEEGISIVDIGKYTPTGAVLFTPLAPFNFPLTGDVAPPNEIVPESSSCLYPKGEDEAY